MKPYYSDYVQHCMRFYARHPRPKFRNDVDRANWYACDRALKGFSYIERDILLAVYREADTIPDNIYNLSLAKSSIKQDIIWELVNELERKIAKKRCLV